MQKFPFSMDISQVLKAHVHINFKSAQDVNVSTGISKGDQRGPEDTAQVNTQALMLGCRTPYKVMRFNSDLLVHPLSAPSYVSVFLLPGG